VFLAEGKRTIASADTADSLKESMFRRIGCWGAGFCPVAYSWVSHDHVVCAPAPPEGRFPSTLRIMGLMG
jgi:hypothetical protein